MVHNGPLGWRVGLALRLSHFSSSKVSYRIILYLRVGQTVVTAPCGIWILFWAMIWEDKLLDPAYWVRAYLRISAQKYEFLPGQSQASEGHWSFLSLCYNSVATPEFTVSMFRGTLWNRWMKALGNPLSIPRFGVIKIKFLCNRKE